MRLLAGAGLAISLAVATTASALAAAPRWPTLAFEVHEGSGSAVPDAAADLARLAGRGLEPLSPQLKAEMEAYLTEVATEYQRMGFPPPALEPIVTRPDGSRAYRVHWYAFGDPGHSDRNPEGVAFVSYLCRGESGRRQIHFNARTEGPNGLHNRLAIATGRSPGMLDQLTDKAYADLAHELFHAVQRGTRFFDANCQPPAWLYEGTAQAIGHDMAWRLRRVRSHHDPFNRWGLRAYYEAFHTGPGSTKEAKTRLGYGSSSFWRYLAELERAMQSPASPPPRPGPQRVVRRDAFDYGYLVRMFSQSPQLRDGGQTLDWIDGWLDADQRLNTHFDRVYADLVTVIAGFGRHRVDGVLPIPQRHKNVLKVLFQDCPDVSLAAAQGVDVKVALDLPGIGARCLRLHRDDSLAGVLAVDLRAEVSAAQARALWLGEVGQTSAVAATVHDHPSHSVANWVVLLEPGQSLEVVIANVASTPSLSKPSKPTISVSVPGWQWTGTGPVPQAQPQLAGKPAPARRRPPPAPAGQDSEAVTHGPGTAQLVREADPGVDAGCRWPHADARTQCGPVMSLVLRRLPRWLAHQAPGLSGAPAEQAGSLESFVASRATDALRSLDEQVVRIRMPQLEHGFTGTVDNVLISVAGEGSEAVSRGPRDVEAGRLAYFPASGRVHVEQYDALVFRGRFEGELVQLPLPNAHGEDRPRLPVVGKVEGRFVVGQPWAGDDRYTAVAQEADDVAMAISDRMPGPLRAGPQPGGAGSPGEAAAGASTGGGQCDCSCAGHARLMAELGEIERLSPEGAADPAVLARAMCLLECQAAWTACAAD